MADDSLIMVSDRPAVPLSKVVGLYQTLMRRYLEHFSNIFLSCFLFRMESFSYLNPTGTQT